MRTRSFLALAMLIVSSVCQAEGLDVLFSRISSGPEPSPAEAYRGTWSVDINHALLHGPARQILLNLPGEPEVPIELVRWESRSGSIVRFDGDGNEYEQPDPNAAPEDFSWFWYGRGGGWTVSLTTHRGIVAGRVTSASRRYGLEPRSGNILQLGLINTGYWSIHPDDVPGVPDRKTRLMLGEERVNDPVAKISQTKNLKGTTVWDGSCSAPLDSPINSTVDVLFFYTPEILNFHGSVPQVEAVVQAAVDDANISLWNTKAYSISFRKIALEPVPPSASFDFDRTGISDVLRKLSGIATQPSNPWCTFNSPNVAVQNRRAAVKADVVALARLDLTTPVERSCGVSWVQRHVGNNGCIMDPGQSNPNKIETSWTHKFAYLVFNPQCSADTLNFAHEIGHILGMEHDPVNAMTSLSGFDPSCPWSFGNRRAGASVGASYRFRSIMAYPIDDPGNIGPNGPAECASETDCPLIDAYTNWGLQWAGPFGIQPLPLLSGAATIGVQTPWMTGQPRAHALDTLQRIGPLVAGYNNPPSELFTDGFQ